ncbi:sugar ABC transporter [Pectobacterium brasiliense]|uniref:ABC transporter ATP-binding protein n=1 Tax=Pectobacterium brasiliense TaxID=180957 RepID=UPI00057E0BD5|nr:ABC transporter ATP-binding protein [Pectobacterium brasiliense]APS31135.1 sugar ABC transporter [Pectobacterium brasiliense]ARA75439.1 sugar ABC transporter [Pectobacterium brasiliense]KHS74229.1 sugar ABC transporter [Pectobacterium brasiliense]KHS95023.1 sugar ABC transporter [Pectobacterium brasiliense]KHT00537.1 sugar ABC transporter [Pectobacterium brasiliense]
MAAPIDILSVQAVSCTLQQSPVLENISFAVRDDETICLLGRNGCGKTALLQVIAGLLPITQGKILLEGEPVSSPQAYVLPELRQVGLIFQDYALFPHLTVEGNIAFGLYGRSDSEVKPICAEMLTLLQLDDVAARYPHELSNEQQQRLAIARALACEPKLLLLDEPFPGLDSQTRYRLITELRQILKQRHVAAVFATHSREEAFACADHLILLDEGKIMQQGYPSELYHRPNSRFVADFMGNTNYLPVKIMSDHQWQSPLGDHQATHPLNQPMDSQCDWMVRPADVALALDPDGPASIEDRLFMGTSNLYRVKMGELMLLVQTGNWFEPGQQVRLSIKTDPPVLYPALPAVSSAADGPETK